MTTEETKISLITVNYNNAKSIDKTLSSLMVQDMKECEFIFIDGGSTDASILKIKSFCEARDNAKYISEDDNGIYEAMNKGVKLASGELIGFVNSGDALCKSSTLKAIWEQYIKYERPAGIYGNKQYVSADGRISRTWRPGKFKRWKYIFGWMTPHQSTYIQRSCYEKLNFDETYKIAGDYKFMFQVFFVNRQSAYYLDEDVVYMETGGVSNGSLKNIFKSNMEVLRAWKELYFFVPIWIFLVKPGSKLLQLVKALGK